MATSSTLNPNAPIFVPLAYRAVEDFSDQWWDLVQSSPCFRDYWIQDYTTFDDAYPQVDPPFSDIHSDHHHPAVDHNSNPAAKEGCGRMDLISLGLLRWKKARGAAETAKYWDKAPKIVSIRVSPRPIKQPR